MATLVEDTARIALGWVAPKSREVASGLVRWALVFAFVAKKTLRVENVSHCLCLSRLPSMTQPSAAFYVPHPYVASKLQAHYVPKC